MKLKIDLSHSEQYFIVVYSERSLSEDLFLNIPKYFTNKITLYKR